MKKWMTISIIAIVILTMAIFATKYISQNRFNKNVSHSIKNMYMAAYIAESTTNEYSEIWRQKINAESYEDIYVDGERRYFRDFSSAVNYKIQKFKDSGVLNQMDSLMSVSKSYVKAIESSLFGNEETKQCVKGLYLNISEYCSLANSPTGTLLSFNSKRNELSANISRNMNELKIYLPDKN